jgi:hypothetical protein
MVQPFTNMYEKPSNASDSLLVDYITVSPLDVAITETGSGVSSSYHLRLPVPRSSGRAFTYTL